MGQYYCEQKKDILIYIKKIILRRIIPVALN